MDEGDAKRPLENGGRLASAAERERVVELLQEQTADGTLTLDEFAERIDRALDLRSTADLDALVADLPASAERSAARGRARHHVVAVMAGAEVKGRWRCDDRVVAVAVMGGCHIDFRGAEIGSDVVHVTAVAVMGGIDIVVPEGIEVTMSGLSVMGGRSLQVKDVPAVPGGPRLHVTAFPVMGGVTVRSRPRTSAKTVAGGEAVAIAAGPSDPPPTSIPLDGTVTIMFVDVCDYSGMTDRLGDSAMHELLREHNARLRMYLRQHGGHEVKSSGDGLMVAFPSVGRAVRCAIAMQLGTAAANEGQAEPVRAHIGIHAGEVVRDGDDFHGSTVIVASRLADVAGPDEILVSSVARELVGGSREFAFEPPRTVTLKGLAEARQAYPVSWSPPGQAAGDRLRVVGGT